MKNCISFWSFFLFSLGLRGFIVSPSILIGYALKVAVKFWESGCISFLLLNFSFFLVWSRTEFYSETSSENPDYEEPEESSSLLMTGKSLSLILILSAFPSTLIFNCY